MSAGSRPPRVTWFDIQENSFIRWCNQHLKDRGISIGERALKTDLCNGIKLIALLEIISGKSLGKYNRHPRIPIQKMENVNIALEFLKKENIKLVNIGAGDIVNGNLKLILGLIWTLILRYQINKGQTGDSSAKNELLEWVRSKIGKDTPYGHDVNNFQRDWNDGKKICALVNALDNSLCKDHGNDAPKYEKAKNGIDTAENSLGVPQLVKPEEMNHPKVDEHAMMAYISYFRDLDNDKSRSVDDADLCRAYGPGLVEGIANEDSNFTVETPGRGKLEVKVEGPKSSATPKVVDKGDGTYDVQYKPTEPGQYKIHVTLDGKHIPGSIFQVTVLPEISLGGEGKILVFFSTTSSSNKGRRDVVDLQRLLEAKQVHKRPDFVPWVPVDIMEREDREAVFKKAGVRKLPIVYVDDKYIGDYDTIQELEEGGKLDALLNYKK